LFITSQSALVAKTARTDSMVVVPVLQMSAEHCSCTPHSVELCHMEHNGKRGSLSVNVASKGH